MALPVDFPERTLQFSTGLVQALRRAPYSVETKILRGQVIRSATSIGANFIESRHASSRKESLRYLEIALRSSRETEYWLALLERLSLLQTDLIDPLQKEANEISRIVATMVLRMKGK